MVEHFMRFWLWVRTAMPTREWVAVHRCHHANVDTDKDPHSPIVYGLWRVVFYGTALYHTAAHNKALVEQYGKGTPNDGSNGASTNHSVAWPDVDARHEFCSSARGDSRCG
jgi:stearoyl-CoA desaturase (delta-9 desaturase)